MSRIRTTVASLGVALMSASAVSAGQTAVPASTGTTGQGQAQGQAQPPPTPPAKPVDPQDVTYKETVVVSASKTEQQLIDAPATISIIGARQLAVAPSTNYAELLRTVPGVNITQISARDVNVTSRGATSSLATSQLTVVDGRSVYQDFFGFTMWDFVPSDADEIKRIEVIRGPASAIWGANALNGVINVLTKSPREMAGTTVTFGAGGLNREVDNNGESGGSLFSVRGTHAAAANDRWAYKFSAGMYASDAFARPTGNVPNGQPRPTPYPVYENQGTQQPKFDVRVDYDFPDRTQKLSFSGGVGGTEGIMHSGIGPFDVRGGSKMGYGKVTYTKNAFKLQAFLNVLDGRATNLVSTDPTGTPIELIFDTKTFDVEAGDTRILAAKHVVTYGGNLRFNKFNLTIAPGEDSRTEGGAYIQDEFLMHARLRLVAGARIDKFTSIENPVFSPRLALVFKPRADQSVRVTYNRAFRAPSMVNNNLETTIGTPLPLGAVNAAYGSAIYYVPTRAIGNPGLSEERIDAFELSYSASLRDRATVTAAWYYNRFSDQILFTEVAEWGPAPAPPGFPGLGPIPGALVWQQIYASGIRFPSQYTYENLGKVTSKGLELGVDGVVNSKITAFASYSYSPDPVPTFPGLTEAEALNEINLPSNHLFSIGATYTGAKAFGTVSMSYASDAFWQDVLDDRFHGPTENYASVNLTAGFKWGGRYAVALKILNLANQQIQQHVFGDIIKRQVMGEFRVSFPK